MRIGSMIIFLLGNLWKARLFVLCDVMFLVWLQGKFEIDHSWEWKGYWAKRTEIRHYWASVSVWLFYKETQCQRQSTNENWSKDAQKEASDVWILRLYFTNWIFQMWHGYMLIIVANLLIGEIRREKNSHGMSHSSIWERMSFHPSGILASG